MRRTILLFLCCGILACDGRRSVDHEDSGSEVADSGSAADGPTYNACPYPDGVCDFNAECGEGYRCEGAMHTTGTPHAFICRGVCVPKASPLVCEPSAEPPLVVALLERGDNVIAAVSNISCRPIYRWVDECCSGQGPRVEMQQADGSWQVGACADVETNCCDEPPFCEILRPGEVREIKIPELSGCRCVEERFRIFARYFEDESCADLHDGPPLGATSNTYTPTCP